MKLPWPEDFTLTPDRRHFAEVGGVDADREFAKFRDHARATGVGYVNWDASWRNWVRNVERFAAPARQ